MTFLSSLSLAAQIVSEGGGALPIIGGEPGLTCHYPTAVSVFSANSDCTATLVHPEIVLLAAHCSHKREVNFGETALTPARTVEVEHCRTSPTYIGSPGPDDYGYCRLAEPVTDLPLTPVALGCELDALERDMPAVVVGFGEDTDGRGGLKNALATTVASVQTGTVSVGGGGSGVCFGDSGGPAYMQAADGTWRAFGIASAVMGACGAGSIHVRMDRVVAWVEQDAGLDITPCFDPDGTWNPDARCGGFATELAPEDAAWEDGCTVPAGPRSSVCGDPVPEVDETPPEVTLINPTVDEAVDSAPLDLDVEVAASDAEFGVDRVWLEINGEAVTVGGEIFADRLAPFTFDGLTLPRGEWTLQAVARDYAGLEGRSDAVVLQVGEPESESSGETKGDTAADSGEDGEEGEGSGSSSTGHTYGFGEGGGPGEPGCGCRADNDGAIGALCAWALMLVRRRRRPRRLGA